MRRLVVSAAVIERDEAFLLTRRAAASHLGGLWEFPGGKVEPGETLEASLVREIREELGCDLRVGSLLLVTSHAYPDVRVELHFFDATLLGQPAPQLGQEMAWIARADLRAVALPAADLDLVTLLEQRGRAPRTVRR